MIKFKAFLFSLAAVVLMAGPASAATDTINFFQSFELYVHRMEIDLADHTFRVMLSNTAPTMTWTTKSQVTEITAGNGYTAGGATLTVGSLSQSGGVMTWVLGANVTWTGTGGSIATARYLYIYDDSHASDVLVGVLDFGSAFTIVTGQTFTVYFSGVTLLTVTTQ